MEKSFYSTLGLFGTFGLIAGLASMALAALFLGWWWVLLLAFPFAMLMNMALDYCAEKSI